MTNELNETQSMTLTLTVEAGNRRDLIESLVQIKEAIGTYGVRKAEVKKDSTQYAFEVFGVYH